jgi:hypothetical protein
VQLHTRLEGADGASGQVCALQWDPLSEDYMLVAHSKGGLRLVAVQLQTCVTIAVFRYPAACRARCVAWLPECPGMFITGGTYIIRLSCRIFFYYYDFYILLLLLLIFIQMMTLAWCECGLWAATLRWRTVHCKTQDYGLYWSCLDVNVSHLRTETRALLVLRLQLVQV